MTLSIAIMNIAGEVVEPKPLNIDLSPKELFTVVYGVIFNQQGYEEPPQQQESKGGRADDYKDAVM